MDVDNEPAIKILILIGTFCLSLGQMHYRGLA